MRVCAFDTDLNYSMEREAYSLVGCSQQFSLISVLSDTLNTAPLAFDCASAPCLS